MLVSTDLNCTPERADRLGTIDGQLFLPEENGLFDREVNALRYLVEPSSPGLISGVPIPIILPDFRAGLSDNK